MATETIQILTEDTLELSCTIKGKPLVSVSDVSWRHSTEVDLSAATITTAKDDVDDFTITSTLVIVKPGVEFSGKFYCTAGETESDAVTVSING